MATTKFNDTPAQTIGDLPEVGQQAPAAVLTSQDLADFSVADYSGKTIVLNVFPSVDTGVCAASVRRFNDEAASLENTVVLCVSEDLPFAHARFCGAEGIDDVVMGSAFRSTFGEDYGLTLTDSPMKGLLARAVIVIDPEGTVRYVQLVDEITTEPDYESALAALK